MPDDVAISVEHVSKAYRIWADPGARLKSPLVDGLARLLPAGSFGRTRLRAKAAAYYRDFYALKAVSFQVRKGEGLGIVGRNGSGKSTLLQIIAGTLQPTTGSVRVNGRVAALLELGSGFNPEFTGRENVYLNAAVLGFTRQQTDSKFDSIAAFADIGDFLDQPVKTYSSGMMMRLAFAVQTAVEPDILIVDEALSVGDAPFQAKCFARIRSMQEAGCATLLVSHDIGTVRAFCQQAVWLKAGMPMATGPATEVCGAYNRECLRDMGMTLPETAPAPTAAAPAPPSSAAPWLAEDTREFEKNAAIARRGLGPVRIRNFFILDEQGRRSTCVRWDEALTAVYVLEAEQAYTGYFQSGIVALSLQGQELLTCADRSHGLRLSLAAGERTVTRLSLRLPLRAGKYRLSTGVFTFPDGARFDIGTFDFTKSIASDLVPHAAFLEIAPQFNLGIYGPVQQDAHLTLAASAPAPSPS